MGLYTCMDYGFLGALSILLLEVGWSCSIMCPWSQRCELGFERLRRNKIGQRTKDEKLAAIGRSCIMPNSSWSVK